MSFSFTQIKEVDACSRDIVNGFIRQCQELLPNKTNTYYTIPDIVIYIILGYFVEIEYFALYPSNIDINEQKDTICVIDNEDEDEVLIHEQISIFGNIRINKSTYYNKFIWKFKISDCYPGVVVGIGIDASKEENKFVDSLFDGDTRTEKKGTFYSCDSFQSRYNIDSNYQKNSHIHNENMVSNSGYGACFTKPDTENTLEMHFDSKNCTLRYVVNDEDQGIAFDHISFDNDEEYSMAISFDDPVCIQLIDFKQYHQHIDH